MQPVSDGIHQLEADNALLSQVLDVWYSLEKHFKAWVVANPALADGVLASYERRFKKHYHPAMAAARLLDPINFVRSQGETQPRLDLDGLRPGQREEVVQLITRLNGKNVRDADAKAAVEEELDQLDMGAWPDSMKRMGTKLMVRTTQDDGSVTVQPTTHRVTLWERHSELYPMCAGAAVRLLSAHVTTAAAERNWSAWGRTYTNIRNRLGIKTAEKMVYIKANKKLPEGEGEEDGDGVVVALDFGDEQVA